MRIHRRTLPALAFGFAIALTAGCIDSPTGTEPTIVEPNASLVGGVVDGLNAKQATVLRRTARLPQDEVVTRTIGRAGGTIVLPQAGLTVRFPAGALRDDTEITVTAPKGDLVGYHFAPHGIRFRKSVTVAQDLTVTEAGALLKRLLDPGLTVAYFMGELKPKVTALEVLSIDILGLLGLGVFEIDHFSGYVIATD